MFATIDNFLNTITMYRLVRYCLAFLWLAGLFLSFFHILPFGAVDLIISFIIIFIACITANRIFEIIFKAPSNTDSTYITALILSLITGPETTLKGFFMLALVSALAISSKYIFAINKKHIFNPAAFGIALAPFIIGYYPSWWVGDKHMAVFVLAAGLLITRKIQRTDLVVSFLMVFLITSLGTIHSLQDIFSSVKNMFAYSPILFFMFVMLTEPTTTPPARNLRIMYGALVAFLIAPFVHIGNIYFSPELALIAGNIFSYLVSPKEKLILTLKEKIKIAANTYDFVFLPDRKLTFKPGQYMEWTLKHPRQDVRGMRRYFTIASSPTENELSIGVKFYEKPSSYKKALEAMHPGSPIVSSQLLGEFTMPKDKNKKLVFLAGGIGITPFRSMIKYLLDTNEKRDITLFYSVKNYRDIAYKEIFDQAKTSLGINTIYVINTPDDVPAGFQYEPGMVDKKMLAEKIPDFQERIFYISGPRAMIVSFETILKELGIPKHRIKTDFFPGYA